MDGPAEVRESPIASDRSGRRIVEVDAVRGFALCGITFVNFAALAQVSVFGIGWFEVLLHQRFFPIFAFVFGLSSELFLRAAAGRTPYPRAILLARLGSLIPLGVVHQMLQPGEVLLPYAVTGIIVLIPAARLPRPAVLAAGAGMTAVALAFGGGILLIPGLLALGMAIGRYGWRPQLGAGPRYAIALMVIVIIAAGLNGWQLGSAPVSHLSGVITGVAYVGVLLLLLQTAIRAALLAVLEPLGRMALTNYVSATLLILAIDDIVHINSIATLAAAGLGVLGLQVLAGRWWLRRFRYGPAEWIWRCATWGQLIPNRAQAP